jgi:hypothetical protein
MGPHQGFIYMFIYMLRLRHFYGNEAGGALRDTIQGPVIKYLCEKYVNYISFIELCMQINVREYQRGKQKRTNQINWQHRIQDEEKQNKHTTQYVLVTTMRKQTQIT